MLVRNLEEQLDQIQQESPEQAVENYYVRVVIGGMEYPIVRVIGHHEDGIVYLNCD